ncbi:MAG: hypothetical protein ABSE59_11735 [Opitutaceae bacterium]
MHQDMYDSKHRFFGLSSTPSVKEVIFQKGMRENLLCHECEQKFGRYEKYASKVFFGGESIGLRQEGNILFFAGLKYAPLKLFFMSLLWRMGVTSLKFLTGVKLGSYEPLIHELLQKEDPAGYLMFPCLISAVMHNRRHIPDLIVPPGRALVEDQHVWTFVAAGFVFSFFVSNRPPPTSVHDAFLKPDGTMCIRIAEIFEIPFLHNHAVEIGQAQRQRDAKRGGRRSTRSA